MASNKPSSSSCDEMFPACGRSAHPFSSFPSLPLKNNNTIDNTVRWTPNRCSVVTQVFRVSVEERKFDLGDKFGKNEAFHTCLVIMRESGAQIEFSSFKDQSLIFLVTGRQNEVMEARRRILIHCQTPVIKQMSIPRKHHRCIRGKKGSRVERLEKNTATKINFPHQYAKSEMITITGTKEGIEKAEYEIRAISDEHSENAFERVNIPKIYHPFIRDENMNGMLAKTGVRISTPPPSMEKNEIIITGEKESVLSVKQIIEAIYTEMRGRCTTVNFVVPKDLHKYVIGPRGSTISEILRLTNVSVEMPSSDSSAETITLRGRQEDLRRAWLMVYEKANIVRTAAVKAPAWIHKHMIGHEGANIKKIMQDLGQVLIEFTDKQDEIKIEGISEEVKKAQDELQIMAKDLISKLIFVELNVDLDEHIIGKNGSSVNRMEKEIGVVINVSENDSNTVIRIEGKRVGVELAKKEIMQLVDKRQNGKEKIAIFDHRYYPSIFGSGEDKVKEISNKFNQVRITIPDPGEEPYDVVVIRGRKKDVDRCHKHLRQLIKKLDRFRIPKVHEAQTNIDLPADDEDSDESYELNDIISKFVCIAKEVYPKLIEQRSHILKIMECLDVCINFPPDTDPYTEVLTIIGPEDSVDIAEEYLLDLEKLYLRHESEDKVRYTFCEDDVRYSLCTPTTHIPAKSTKCRRFRNYIRSTKRN